MAGGGGGQGWWGDVEWEMGDNGSEGFYFLEYCDHILVGQWCGAGFGEGGVNVG